MQSIRQKGRDIFPSQRKELFERGTGLKRFIRSKERKRREGRNTTQNYKLRKKEKRHDGRDKLLSPKREKEREKKGT